MAPVYKTQNNAPLNVNDHSVNVTKVDGEDYICLTDMAKAYGADRVIDNWLRNKNTIDFLGVWERYNNPDFNFLEFEEIKNVAGLNRFTMSAKQWVQTVNARGIVAKAGRYGGTYAHRDIAFEFGAWLSPEFRLLIITEYQRLKAVETKQINWDARRVLASVNYKLHTDAIRDNIIPSLTKGNIEQYVYTNEADMLNRLTFGQTANEWRSANPELAKSRRNQRDYASEEQLMLIANLQNLNAFLLAQKLPRDERLKKLAEHATKHYQSILKSDENRTAFLEGEKKRLANEN
ncbi:KilA-N domain-containing protein [Candidatus Saccharibacteria bacterium]|nr:KilA-N domain-containing protein [Candidatus Saccharibacteria bacterium]